ncbi:hypothetical protein GCM10011581_22300 [Saccharopolyspora subtropica]|uniref:Maleylpyruvate isomerase family mycothiol-dependent enzyme n=1 Tax=Saccharopolyspora thermophila TaxID=89367 RepID=A0A917NBJ7_9PSEU|nr:maleylpyruvate isomerase family mycothiol-dependent enzyme [Saccharopolyspora subtropica]GGI84717.1 hypothetical protein GCM10011581_22300 [Saccharopolyspora subtropica]
MLSFDRYCDEIVAQTELLRSHLAGADLSAPVTTCPGWNLAHLVRHLGGAHRWATAIVRTRATEPVPDDQVNDVSDDTRVDPAELLDWLADGAKRLADALRTAGPETPVWTPPPDGTAIFWARRMAQETAVHRFDAAAAAGATYSLDPEVAADGLDEWLDFGALPQLFEEEPQARDLLGPGRSLHFHATDTAADRFVDLTDEPITWRRERAEAAVAVRGAVVDLLLAVYRRVPAGTVAVNGDRALFDDWRDRLSYWLQ